MKIRSVLAVLLFAGCCFAVASPRAVFAQQAPAAQPGAKAAESAAMTAAKIDPAKAADIRKLLEVTGTKKIMADTMAAMSQTIRPAVTRSLPPGDYREKLVDLFFEKFQSKADPSYLLEQAIPVYDKHFSQEEIRGMIKFYETPLGQKAIATLPQIMGEMRELGQKWGEQMGRESMQEVLQEHPELQKALEEAANK